MMEVKLKVKVVYPRGVPGGDRYALLVQFMLEEIGLDPRNAVASIVRMRPGIVLNFAHGINIKSPNEVGVRLLVKSDVSKEIADIALSYNVDGAPMPVIDLCARLKSTPQRGLFEIDFAKFKKYCKNGNAEQQASTNGTTTQSDAANAQIEEASPEEEVLSLEEARRQLHGGDGVATTVAPVLTELRPFRGFRADLDLLHNLLIAMTLKYKRTDVLGIPQVQEILRGEEFRYDVSEEQMRGAIGSLMSVKYLDKIASNPSRYQLTEIAYTHAEHGLPKVVFKTPLVSAKKPLITEGDSPTEEPVQVPPEHTPAVSKDATSPTSSKPANRERITKLVEMSDRFAEATTRLSTVSEEIIRLGSECTAVAQGDHLELEAIKQQIEDLQRKLLTTKARLQTDIAGKIAELKNEGDSLTAIVNNSEFIAAHEKVKVLLEG